MWFARRRMSSTRVWKIRRRRGLCGQRACREEGLGVMFTTTWWEKGTPTQRVGQQQQQKAWRLLLLHNSYVGIFISTYLGEGVWLNFHIITTFLIVELHLSSNSDNTLWNVDMHGNYGLCSPWFVFYIFRLTKLIEPWVWSWYHQQI